MKIFLDIDGVMVHANPTKNVDFENDGFYEFNSEAINGLKLLNHESNELILSTSHRFRYTLSEWFNIFKRRGLCFENISIIDCDKGNLLSRCELIMNWVKEKNIKTYDLLIIDDDKSLNNLEENYKSRLLLTQSYIGLKISNLKTKLEELKWVKLNKHNEPYPPEGVNVLVSDDLGNEIIAYFILSGEYRWVRYDDVTDECYDLYFTPTKWKFIN